MGPTPSSLLPCLLNNPGYTGSVNNLMFWPNEKGCVTVSLCSHQCTLIEQLSIINWDISAVMGKQWHCSKNNGMKGRQIQYTLGLQSWSGQVHTFYFLCQKCKRPWTSGMHVQKFYYEKFINIQLFEMSLLLCSPRPAKCCGSQ